VGQCQWRQRKRGANTENVKHQSEKVIWKTETIGLDRPNVEKMERTKTFLVIK